MGSCGLLWYRAPGSPASFARWVRTAVPPDLPLRYLI